MLRYINELPHYKNSGLTHIRIFKSNLLEIYITMFLQEIVTLIKKGLFHNYIHIKENLNMIKGKIAFTEHIKQNIVHKHKIYCQYDEFLPDTAENRILKSAILLLKKLSRHSSNIKLINELQFVFYDIPESSHIDNDIKKLRTDRSTIYYKNALFWAKLFLKGQSFSSYSGLGIAFSLLYPMEKIFERYVARLLKMSSEYNFSPLKTPDRKYYLLKEGDDKLFRLEPDFVGYTDNHIYIMDTKWKLLDENDRENKYGISQQDLYQLVTYAKIYQENDLEKRKIVIKLFYPETKKFKQQKSFHLNSLSDDLDIIIQGIKLID